jgi:N-acetylgalactosamine kinase
MEYELCSVTLAAGAGTRMPEDMPPKTCCRVGPLTVIEHCLQAYEAAGIRRHVVVVGCRADEVMGEISPRRPGVLFAYQREPLGTGDAVRCALDLLAANDPPEHVLISAGDKMLEPAVVRGLVEAYAAGVSDLLILAGRAEDYPGTGQLVMREERVAAILETPDIKVRQLARRLASMPAGELPRTGAKLSRLAAEFVSDKRKLPRVFPELAALIEEAGEGEVPPEAVRRAADSVPEEFLLADGSRVSLEEAAGARRCNLGVYVGRFELLRDAVARLGRDNVQRECYFTDAVAVACASGSRTGLFRIEDPGDVMSFNTLAELEEVRRVHAVRALDRRWYPRLAAWNGHLSQLDPGGLAARAVRALAANTGPERPCVLVRSPGRINLMGRHVDHQGGTCNLMAIDREIVVAASLRDDDRVNLWNVETADYPPRTFTFGELLEDVVWEDWLRTLDSQYLQRLVSGSLGDWVNYVKGAALRLQHRFPDRRLRGIDAAVAGNIPVGAGLSSSSALVVAATEALTELNALNLHPRELVDLCGEGEWFVGTRGGSGDHAAIKFGREGEVVSVSFFPFEVVGTHPFPEDCALIVCHSGLSAKKMENARERFNARVACYHMAREVVKRDFPEFADRIRHLRDINERTLDVSLPTLYRILGKIPRSVSGEELTALASLHSSVEKCISGLKVAEHEFPLRDVAFYGVAECERSRLAGGLLDRGDVTRLARMMNVSHDGDRVARWGPDCEAFARPATDEHVRALVDGALAVEPLESAGAALWQQPGAYGCSTPEIDHLVDAALACRDVLGAQLAGAGLGGCIMVLARREGAEQTMAELTRTYYEPRGFEPRMFLCRPSHGSSVLTSVEALR